MIPAAALTPEEITERLRAAVGAGVDQETGQDMITVRRPAGLVGRPGLRAGRAGL